MRHKSLRQTLTLSLIAILSLCAFAALEAANKDEKPTRRPLVYTVVIEGAIGAVTDDRIAEAVALADEKDAELLIIQLDTPGGFSEATSRINKSILNSEVPVCLYVAPSGARAGSAGVYITYACHFAAMAPSTNIGSAHPVSGSGEEIDSIMNEKITNDAVAQIKASAELRGRNKEWAEQAVRESVNITDVEALELNVINFRAEDMDDLLAQLDGQETEVPSGTVTLNTNDARVVEIEITFVQRVLEVITSPSLVFIMFSIGGLGIMLELYHPGAIFPGVVGAICLILAFYASQQLPINWAGVALIMLAIILFIMEIKIISHGLLTIGGVISLFLGGLMLVDTVDPTLQVSKSVLWTVVILIGLCAAGLIWLVAKAAGNKPFIGNEGLIGKTAEVRQKGMVYVDGALWKAESDEELEVGAKVVIAEVNDLTLKVSKVN